MPGESRDNPLDRPTARVVLLDRRGRMLLFTIHEPDAETGKRFWFPPGGGLDPGETHEEAARRELLEETGIDAEPGPCLWLREPHTWYSAADGAWYRSIERYFLVQVDRPTLSTDRWTAVERRFVAGYRWWSLAEIVRSTDVFVPRRLGELLAALLAGDLPSTPLTIGI